MAVLGELLYLYTPFCEIHDNNDGTYTVDYYITKKNKGVTTYTVGIDLFSKVGRAVQVDIMLTLC